MHVTARPPQVLHPAPALVGCPGRSALTPGGQTDAAAPVLAGAALTRVRVEHAAQLQLGQAHHLGEAAALVLQGQLVVIQHH